MAILSSENRAALLRYKYKGSDASPIYNHILSPFAQRCVDLVPTWVAPNLITLVGFLIALSAVVLSLVFNPALDRSAPRWVSAYNGVALFVYQTMDNMDGKQARKLGASSALGMMFDHICDAFNTALSTVTVSSALGCGWDGAFVLLLLGYFAFYIQTWEEYYRGEMAFPFFNGPTEGLLLIVGMCLLSAYHGTEWWWEPLELSEAVRCSLPFLSRTITRYHATRAFFLAFGTATCLYQLKEGISLAMTKQKRSFFEPLATVSPVFVLAGALIAWVSHSQIALQEFPVLTLTLSCFVFVEGVTHLMLQMIVEDELRPAQRYLTWMMLGLVANVCFTPVGQPIVDERLLLGPFLCIAVGVCANTLVMICNECCDTLNIFVFQLGKRVPQKQL